MSNVRRPNGIVPTWFELFTAITLCLLAGLFGFWFVPDNEWAQNTWIIISGVFVGMKTRDIAHWIRTEL